MCATPSRQARDVLLEEAKAEAEKDKEMVDSVVARIAAEDDREVRQTSKTADPTTGVSRQPACAPSGRAPGPACASPFRPIARATLSRAPACAAPIARAVGGEALLFVEGRPPEVFLARLPACLAGSARGGASPIVWTLRSMVARASAARMGCDERRIREECAPRCLAAKLSATVLRRRVGGRRRVVVSVCCFFFVFVLH